MTRRSAPQKNVPEPTLLRLYVAGSASNSALARAHLGAFLAEHPERSVEIEVIDVLVNPERGLDDGILVTPTLVRVRPAPQLRVVGNLRNRDALVLGIGFAADKASS